MRELINLLLLAALLRLPLLLTAGVPLFDEAFYVPSAKALLSGLPDPVGDQAFLGRYVIAGSIAMLGDNRLGWRLPSLIAGTACVGLLYLISLKLGLGRRLSILAAALLALDPLNIAFSRVAMLDIFALVFSLAGLCVLLSAKNPRQWLAAGLLFGMAVASKWPAILAVAGALCFIFIQSRKRHELPRPLLFLLFITLATYMLTCLPLIISSGPGAFIGMHSFSLDTHLSMQGGAQISRPWEWLFGRQPIWLGWNEGTDASFAAVALANPLVWWASLAAMLSVFGNMLKSMADKVRGVKKRFRPTGAEKFCLVWFGATWLPWLLLPREHTFLYYMLPALPAYFIALASFVKRNPWKWAVPAIVAAAIVGLALFYPVVVGITVPNGYFEAMRWWIGWKPL